MIQKINKFGFLRVKAVSPQMEIANVKYNVDQMIIEIKKAHSEKVSIVVFPELGITGYTCDDLFHQNYLLTNAKKGLLRILKETQYMDMVITVGMPYQMPDGRLFNTAVVIHKGKILGMTLKKYLPNYSEFYDMRYFASGLDRAYSLEFEGQKFEATNQVYQIKDMSGKVLGTLGVEICEDLWAVIPPSSQMALCGADIILNLSASNALVGKNQYRKELLSQQSGRLNCVYVYVSSGPNESVKDTVFSGSSYIYENGNLLAEGETLVLDKNVGCVADVDLDKIQKERRQNTTFGTGRSSEQYKITELIHNPETTELNRTYLKNPFIPSQNPQVLAERCEEILDIISTSLARSLKGSKVDKLICGISGGSDSTLTAICCSLALIKANRKPEDLITVTMPGFGTSTRTLSQAKDISTALKSSFLEIDICDTSLSQFKDIGHPQNLYNTTYENVQARMRTNVLFNLANKHNGLFIGSNSLSELALSWTTFAGDSISHISCCSNIPKSLTKIILKHLSNTRPELKDVIDRVLGTLISPELLPTVDKTTITQSSEATVGNYDIVDFCIYHYFKNGFSKYKINFLLNHVYAKDESVSKEELKKTLDTFLNRHFLLNFKKTMFPQGIRIGSFDLSPRSGLRMPDLSRYEDEE